MKKILSLVLAMAGFASIATAQTAYEIVAKHLEARGGVEKLKSIKTLTMEGGMQQGGVDVLMKYYFSQGKASKVEFTAMNQTGYNIVTTTEGWTFNPFQGNSSAEAMQPETLKESQIGLDLIPLLDYKSKGYSVEYLGKESIQGNEYYKLKLNRPSGKPISYWLDKNYLLFKAVQVTTVEGQERETVTEYSDYRKSPEGLLFPYKRNNGQTEITFDKIEVNPKIDDAVFKPSN